MAKYFADVSNYQRDDLAFFQSFVNAGVNNTLILLTEGSADGMAFVNPKVVNQARNALKAGMGVGFYHYLMAISNQDSINEAKFFDSKIKELGFGKDTPVVCDVEDGSLNKNKAAHYVDVFIDYMKQQGYTNVLQYSYANWFNTGVLDPYAHPTWVASYGSADCGTRGNILGWQYTSTWGGGSQDMSFDWGIFDKVNNSKPAEKTVKSTIVNVVTALSGAVKGYTTYNSKGIADKDTNIAPLSMWKSNGIKVIDKKVYFQIATDIFLPQSSTTLKDILIINYVSGYGVNSYDRDGNYIKDSNLKFKAGTSWQVAAELVNIKNIGWCYQVATNEFVPIKYQVGSGYKG